MFALLNFFLAFFNAVIYNLNIKKEGIFLYSKHKDALPEDTIRRIQNIFRELDINPSISVLQNAGGIYSAIMEDKANGWHVNGKGTTKEYCLASAYGEFMERLQNMFLLPTERISREAMKYGGFLLFPDECLLTQDAVCNAKDAFSQGIVTDYYQGSFLLECRKKERMQVLCDYGADGSDPEECW